LVKKLAAIEKCDAEPPRMSSTVPLGVSTESKAMEPTTSKDTIFTFLGARREV
jgi:hypothetical protein